MNRMATAPTNPNSGIERVVATVSIFAVLGLVALVAGVMHNPAFVPPRLVVAAIDPAQDPKGHANQARLREIDARFQQAVAMMHAKKYDYALQALHRVLQLSPRLPQAHINMGFVLVELHKPAAAADFFTTALELSPYEANAYYGLAEALEQMGDLQGALGAMRSYIHLSKPDDPYVRKARAALGEWDYALKRGPLPKEEKAFLDRGTRQWEQRNSPDLDKPEASQMQREIPVGR